MAVGDDDPVVGIFQHVIEERVAGFTARQPQHARRECKQREDADHPEKREQHHDIGAGLAAADQQQAGCRHDEADRDQKYHRDAAPAFAALADRVHALHGHDESSYVPAAMASLPKFNGSRKLDRLKLQWPGNLSDSP